MLDQTDKDILRLLKQNARLQWREIGEQVHMTGQAVGARIRKLEDTGVIQGYTVMSDPAKQGMAVQALVTVFLKSWDHQPFLRYLQQEESVSEAHRVSGEGCYQLRVIVEDTDALNAMLDRLLEHGNYRVNMLLGRIK
ncbi:Lrp/AsnC family transcriptional regulator [Paenibacillus filicis]|uniref:Lrp/AsnC family transcriptional regulator n=1 Tax=Paenibacillus filicis TaxID=669464 RepID=A0ABU9DJQ7_9BACL